MHSHNGSKFSAKARYCDGIGRDFVDKGVKEEIIDSWFQRFKLVCFKKLKKNLFTVVLIIRARVEEAERFFV